MTEKTTDRQGRTAPLVEGGNGKRQAQYQREFDSSVRQGYVFPQSQLSLDTPSIAFRHLPPKKDVVNQCLEFVFSVDSLTVFCSRRMQSNALQFARRGNRICTLRMKMNLL